MVEAKGKIGKCPERVITWGRRRMHSRQESISVSELEVMSRF
jgi:hypothetical protein